MILTPIHKVATHHIITASKAVCGHFLDLNGIQRWRVLLSVLTITLLCAPSIWADPYEVLVVDIAGANNVVRVEEYKKDATKFNALNQRGYTAARPYFNVLQMADGEVYFVFGFRNEVQGIHRRNYSGTIENLRRIRQQGAPKYPHMHWRPVEEIRRLWPGRKNKESYNFMDVP